MCKSLKKELLLIFFAIFLIPCACAAQEEPIGYLSLPFPKRLTVQQWGMPSTVILDKEQGEVWPEEEQSTTEVRKFPVYAFPDEKSEKIAEVDGAGAVMTLVTVSRPGTYSFDSLTEERKYHEGTLKILVFEKRKDWVRVQFALQPPWNGQDGWVKLGPSTGGYIENR